MTAPHPFTEIESHLAAPKADGMMLTSVVPGSPLDVAGLVVGDTIVAIDGSDQPPSRAQFNESIRKLPEGPDTRRYGVLAVDGTRRDVEVALPLRGVGLCAVTAGQSAWDGTLIDDAEPDFSAFEGGLDIYLRNSMEQTPAGHEVLRVHPAGDGRIDVEILFRLGGDDGQGGTWDYHTRALATLRLAPGLPAVRTAFWEMGKRGGDLRLQDGVWRGERDTPDGTHAPVEVPGGVPVCTAYMSTLLPLTMPLRTGARLTYIGTGDGLGVPQGRLRFECVGQEAVEVEGKEVSAWCFHQRHYGLAGYGGDERFYVTEDRRLVRVDWGPNYAGCCGESVPRDQVNDGVPEHVWFLTE